MKLNYRGVNYEYTPNPIPLGPTVKTGKYRGNTVEFKAIAGQVPEQPSAELMWRGTPYRTGSLAPVAAASEPIAATAVAPAPVAGPVAPVATATTAAAGPEPTDKIATLARDLFVRHHQRIRKRERAMMVRLAAEVGLPFDAARGYESQIQGKVPHDFSGYDRSHAAMS